MITEQRSTTKKLHTNPGTLNLALLLSPEKRSGFVSSSHWCALLTHNPSFTGLITWALCTFRVSPIHFLPCVYPLLYHHISLPPSALFLTTLIFNMNIREAWFQVCSCGHTGKSLLLMASSLDHSKTWFIFKVPHCTLLTFNIFWQ